MYDNTKDKKIEKIKEPFEISVDPNIVFSIN